MLTRHVNRTYRNSNIVVRTKAPAVLAVLLFIVVLVPVPVVTNLLDGDYLFAVILTVLEIAMIVSLVMLLRGRFRVATAVPLLVTLLAMTGWRSSSMWNRCIRLRRLSHTWSLH